jgi:uncharacterized protein YndB with AHSA1/START domain
MTHSRLDDPDLLPLRKSVTVPVSKSEAFTRFTADIAKWWPLSSHSVGGDDATGVVIEPRVGGSVYERQGDITHPWGAVLAWNPPHSFRMTWHPGRSPETAQEVEVRFIDAGSGTRIELVQTGWEKLGDAAPRTRMGYESGWNAVLAKLERWIRNGA